jgi:hypothetical protein
MRIVIETIPHAHQRYPTLGDYWIDENGDWQIRVSNMNDVRSVVAIALHELFEMASVIYKKRDNPQEAIKAIDAFDIMFEEERSEGKHPNDAEPGYDSRSPYMEAHFSAEQVERHFLIHTGLMWPRHEENCDNAA